MTSPYQTDSLQGHCRVNGGVLAAKDAGTGSGWQQSKPNCALSAVKGELVRMASVDRWQVQNWYHCTFWLGCSVLEARVYCSDTTRWNGQLLRQPTPPHRVIDLTRTGRPIMPV